MCLPQTHTCSCPGHRMPNVYHCVPCCDEAHIDQTAGCPCRVENGGSGICGCVLSGWKITC